MNNSKLITAILCCLFTISLSAQVNIDPEIGLLHSNDLKEFNDININSSQVFDEDLLIATRRNNIDETGTVGLDSVEYVYNVNDNLEQQTQLLWDGLAWVNDFRTNYEYDLNGNETLLHRQVWDSIGWADNYQYIYEYDNNNLIKETYQEQRDDAWENLLQILYTYDANNNLIEISRNSFFDDEWTEYERNIISYNSENLRTEYLTDRWDGIVWTPKYKSTYQYDENDNLIVLDRIEWNDPNWDQNRYIVYEYDEQNNLISFDWSFVSLEGFGPQFRGERAYDNENLLVQDVFLVWMDSDWVNSSMTDLFYDDRENLIYALRSVWNPGQSFWGVSRETFYYYKFISATDEISKNISIFNIYPNPNNGIFELETISKNSDKVVLEIYSIEGKMVDKFSFLTSSGKSSINLAHLGAGSYILKASSKEGNSTQKIFIQK